MSEEGGCGSFTMLLKAGSGRADFQRVRRITEETDIGNGEISRQRIGTAILKADVQSRMSRRSEICPLRRIARQSTGTGLNWNIQGISTKKRERKRVGSRRNMTGHK